MCFDFTSFDSVISFDCRSNRFRHFRVTNSAKPDGMSEDDDDEEEDEDDEEESGDEDDEGEGDDEDGESSKSNVPQAKKAAAAMCVGMGSFSDPLEAQGLAHFLGFNYSTSFGSQTCNRIQLQHNSITTVFNYSRIQLQHNSIPQHYNQPNRPSVCMCRI